MSERDEGLYLVDMLTAAHTALRYMHGRARADLENDGMLRDAVVRQLEVLGEAASHVSDATRARSGEVPWRGIVGMRNVLIHAYHRVDNDEVWAALQMELPAILPPLERLVREAKPRGT